MKFIYKVMFLFVFVFSLNTVSVFANITVIEGEDKKKTTEVKDKFGIETLDLEKAIQLAASHNDTVKKLDISIANIDENLKILRDQFYKNMGYLTNLSLESQQRQLDNSRNIAEKELKEQNIIIRKKVEDSFVGIIQANKTYEAYKKTLPIEEEIYKIAKVKRGLNLLSERDFDAAKAAYEKTISSDTIYLNNIKEAYRKLNELMGAVSSKTYNLDYKVDYKKMPILSVDMLISDVCKSDSMYLNTKNSLELKEYELETYYDRTKDPMTGVVNENALSKDYKEREIWQLTMDLNARESLIRKTAITLHDAIINQEKNYEIKVSDLKEAKEKLRVSKVQYDIGKIIKLDLDKAELNVYNIEKDLEFLILDHNLNVIKIQNIPLLLT